MKRFIKSYYSPLLLASIIILTFLVQYHFVSAHRSPTGDDGHYLQLATNIVQGQGQLSRLKIHFFPFNDAVEHPNDSIQPLIPYLFAALFRISGPSYMASKILLIFINLISVILVYLIGAAVFDKKIGLFGALLVGLYPSQIFFWTNIVYSSESVFTALFLLTCWLLFKVKQSRLLWVIVGVLIGLLYLTRPNGLWLVIPLIITLLLLRHEVPLKKSAISLAALLLVCLPWFVRNAILFGNPIYISAQHNYWLDNYSQFSAVLDYLPALTNYLVTHSALAITERLSVGLQNTFLDFLALRWGLASFIPFSLLAALMLTPVKRFAFFYCSLLISGMLLVWYAPVFSVQRFFVPFHPLILLWGIGGIFYCASLFGTRRVMNNPKGLPYKHLFIALSIIVLCFPALATLAEAWPQNDRAKDEQLSQVTQLIQQVIPVEGTLMVHAHEDLHQRIYQYQRKTVLVPNNDFRTIMRAAAKYEVDYLVISPRLLADKDKGFQAYFTLSARGIEQAVDFCFLQPAAANKDRTFLIYRIAPQQCR